MHLRRPATEKTRTAEAIRRPVVMHVASWHDARLDLTAAEDLHAGLGSSFESHIAYLSGPDFTPAADKGLNLFGRDDSHLTDALEDLFRSVRPHVVHTHRFGDLEAVIPAVHRSDIQSVLYTPGTIEDAAPVAGKPLFQAIGRRIVVVPYNEDPAMGWKTHRLPTIRPGVDCNRFKPGDLNRARRKIGLPVGPRIIGCASPSVDLDPLFAAMFRLTPDVQLALFGPAVPTREQRQTIRRLDLEERIHVLGPWAQPELIYRAIDCYFHGPCGEAFPRPLLAAQACQKPVIATSPARPEILCPFTGNLLPTLFVPALTTAIQSALAAAPAVSARTFIQEHWNTDGLIESCRDVLMLLAEGPAAIDRIPAHCRVQEATSR